MPTGHYPRPDPVVKFWRNLPERPEAGCWVWRGTILASGGYGAMGVRGKPTRMHRFSWELHYGPIPPGLHVLHRCDNPPCVRPDHLFLGTNDDNIRDMRSKGRGSKPPQRYGVEHHHAKLTPEKVREIRARYAAGEPSPKLAREFGLSSVAVLNAIKRKTWFTVE